MLLHNGYTVQYETTMPVKIYKNAKDSYPGLELPKHGGGKD
jgi:hypothetical protein